MRVPCGWSLGVGTKQYKHGQIITNKSLIRIYWHEVFDYFTFLKLVIYVE